MLHKMDLASQPLAVGPDTAGADDLMCTRTFQRKWRDPNARSELVFAAEADGPVEGLEDGRTLGSLFCGKCPSCKDLNRHKACLHKFDGEGQLCTLKRVMIDTPVFVKPFTETGGSVIFHIPDPLNRDAGMKLNRLEGVVLPSDQVELQQTDEQERQREARAKEILRYRR